MYTINELKEIIKKYTISYYTSRKIEVKAADSDTSYYDIESDTIVISIKSLKFANSEANVRATFYHEVAHALYTPQNYFEIAKMLYNEDNININISYSDFLTIANIIEDERIETIAANLILDVDFAENILTLSPYQEAKTPMHLLFNIVRLHTIPADFLSDKIKYVSPEYLISRNVYRNLKIGYRLYQDCVKYFNNKTINEETSKEMNESSSEEMNESSSEEMNESSSKEMNESSSEETNESSSEETNESSSEETNESSSEEMNESSSEETNESSSEETNESIKHKINRERHNIYSSALNDIKTYQNISSRQTSNDILKTKIKDYKKYFESALQSKGILTSSYSSTSHFGKINKKLVGNDNFKWFTQNGNEVSSYNKKININLWLDISDSYKENVLETTAIVRALSKTKEINNLKIVWCGYGQTVLNEINYSAYTHIANQYTKLFDADKTIKELSTYRDAKNIVLYDGDFRPDETLRYMNNQNYIFILDYYENYKYADKLNKAKVIYTNKYTCELAKNLYNILKQL